MGNKPSSSRRHRSMSELDGGNGGGQRRRSKPSRSQSTSQVDSRRKDTRMSMPDLGGAVPYKPQDDAKEVDVKLYHSYGNLVRPKSGLLGESRPDIKVYRKSTEGINRYQSLPRNYGRSKSTTAVPNGDYPELRPRTLPYDPAYPPLVPQRRSPPGSESGRESQRTSKRVSAASSVSSLAKAPVSMEDFPTTAQIKRKIKCFEDQFCRSLVDKYAGLADTLQLSALAIALAKDPSSGKYRQVSLLDYLDTDNVPLDLLSEPQDRYVLLIPDALFHGLMHVRKDKISELDLWTNLARDLVTCVGIEAANEISRMFEYQIVLLTGDSAVRVLADHAAACVIEHVKRSSTYLDRNSAVVGVVKGAPSAAVSGSPKYLSVILGNRELKWEVQDVLKRPGLRKDLMLTSGSLDAEDFSLRGPWEFYTSMDCNPQVYGYRGQLLHWDWINKTYRVDPDDEKSFPDDISDPMDYPEDFHRMFYPYKRLFGEDFMAKYCEMKQSGKIDTSLAQYLNDTAGDAGARDHIHPVYRPQGQPTEGHSAPANYNTCNFDNVDLTRGQFKHADLSQTSVRNSKLLMTDMEGARLSSAADGSGSGAQMRGADVSYTTLAENTMDQQALDGIVARHVVVMRPKNRRRAAAAKARQQLDSDEIKDDGTTPVTTKPAKKKKKVPKTLNLDGDANDVTDGRVTSDLYPELQNGDPDEVDELGGPRESVITDSQGNLLEIDQATDDNTKRPKKVKRKVKKSRSSSEVDPSQLDSEGNIIEQKQKKIREKKKKTKKRPVQPIIATTPTETIPETPVFVEEAPPLTRSSPRRDSSTAATPETETKHFFTESYREAPIVRTQTVVIQQLPSEPPSGNRRSSDGSSGQRSVTDPNLIDDTRPVSTTEPEPEVVVAAVPTDNNNKTKTKKSKKSGDKKPKSEKKKKKRNSSSTEQPPVNGTEHERPHSVAGGQVSEPRYDAVDHIRPVSAVPVSASGKSLSTTDINRQMPVGGGAGLPSAGLYPRMTKSLSHHGNLGVGNRLHNLSLDGGGLGLRTARQIYSLSKEDIEYITRSQIFNMIKGLQIENLESNLPEPCGRFVGRDRERDDLVEMLGSSGCLVTVTGCYGNGKSSLANAVAVEIQKKFVVPVVVDTRGSSCVASIARRMVAVFGLHFRLKEFNLFYNWLNCHEQRLFFILDNMDIPSSEDTRLSDLIDDVMRNVKDVRILCTSRRNFYKGSLSHEVYRLGNLDNASVELLNHYMPDLHEEGLEILAEICAYNPQTLNIVSKTFQMDEMDTGKLFEDLAQSQTHGLLDRVELALFEITEDEAELDILRRLTCCVLRLVDNIPLGHAELLANASHFASTFDVKTLATLTGRKDTDEVESALDELAEVGLVLKDGDRYILPPLIKFVNQSKLATDGSATLEYFQKTVEDLKLVCAQYHSKRCEEAVKSFDENYDNYLEVLSGIIEREDAYELCPSFASLEYGLFLSECLPEETYLNFYESYAQEAEDNDDVAKQCRALCCLVHKLISDEHVETARQTIETVAQLIVARPSEISDTERAFCLRCQGKVLWEQKEERSRALILVKKALDMYKVSQGSRDLQTIFTNELYAWMLTRKETHQTARHFYNISDLFIKEMMDEHPLLIDGFDCRRTIWDQLCLFQRATDIAKKAVDVSKKFYGEHPTTAKMLTNLCESIIKRGSLNDAISAGINALAIRSKVLGDHMDTGQSYKTLAYLMLRSGQYDEASRFGQSALDIFDKVDANDKLKTDVKAIIAQARYRLDYKSHVYVELQGRDASTKHLSNGHNSTTDSGIPPTPSPVSTTV